MKMASALAQQLAQLSTVKGPQERYVRGKPSLLFDYQKAADVSAETLLGIAQQGVETLWKADKRFAPFPESLFSRASLSISRDQLTKDENNELNTKLRAFLHVLANHFLAPAAFQALEYCIRRYQVHVYNVDELLVCALPYHATPEFARLVALLQLKGTAWEWLGPCQQSGAPPPRELLVRRCVNDQAVLREVCKGAQALGVAGFVSKTYLSFYAVLLCEVLAASPQVTEQLLNGLLPYLVAGLKDSAARDYRAATLMVLTQLLSRAQLQRDFLAVIVAEVMRSAGDLGGSTALMLLAHMAASQPQLQALAPRALQLMAEQCEEAGQQLADLQARGANLQPLLKLLLPSLAHAVPNHPQLQPLLVDLLNNVNLDPAQVEAAALQLLQAGALLQQQHQGGEAAGQHLRQVLQVFDLKFPDQLDAAINKALQQAAVPGAAVDLDTAAGKKTSKQKKGKQRAVTDADSMFEFVQQCFSGSRHEVVPAVPPDSAATGVQQQQQQQQALTLSLAVGAPASQMRIMALQKLDAICAGVDAPESTQQLLQSSLVTCLRDEVFAVAGAAATAAGLAAVSADQQLPALQQLLARAAEKLTAGSATAGNATDGSNVTSGGKEILKAAKAALAAVAAVGARAAAKSDAADSGHVAAVQQQAALILLEYVLADKRLKKLSKACVNVCCSATWHPLLQAVSAAPAVSAALQHATAAADTDAATPAASDSKRRKKSSKAEAAEPAPAVEGKHAAAVAINRAVVQALADALCSRQGGAALLTSLSAVASTCGPRCCHLLLLALVKAVTTAPTEAAAAADVQPTPARGKAKSRQPRHSSSQAVGDDQQHPSAATSAHIALVLLQMLERALGATAQQGGSSSSSFVLPDSWQAAADAVLDASQLPTQQHLQQLHSELLQLQAALLLSGLKTALEAAAPDSLTGLLGQPVLLFARIAAAAAAAGSAGCSLLDHLQLLVQKSCEQPQQQLAFVAGIYGLPAGSCAEAVQVAALQLLQRQCRSSTTGDGSTSSSWFVSLLAAVDSSNKAVRNAAVDALLALPEAINSSSDSWSLPGGFSSTHLVELVAALQQHKALLRGSTGALTPLLCSGLAAAACGMDVDSGAGSGKGRGTRRGSRTGSIKASSNAESDAGDSAAVVSAHAELQLPASCAAAVQQLLIAALPELHSEASLTAAELAIAALSAGAAATDVAPAAQQLLQVLVQGLCAHAAKAAASEKAARPTGQLPAWQQLSALEGGSAAVSDTAAQLQQLRAAVSVPLLQFYTSESLQADASLASSYVNLLQLPLNGAAAAAAEGVLALSSSSKLTDAQLAATAPVRTAALQQLDAGTFAVLPPDQQQAVFAAALQTHATDGDAGCRAAARLALEQIPVTAGMLLQLLQRVDSSPATNTSQQQQTRAKRSKRASTVLGSQQEAMEVDAAAAGPVLAVDLDAAIGALELLQWKESVHSKLQLLQPLQQLLQLLIPLMGSIAESHREDDSVSAGDDVTSTSDRDQHASPSAAGYAAQLALSALEQLVKEQQGSSEGGRVDPSLVLACASAAPDGAVRNAALLLLAVLSRQSPEDVLGHVLQALAVIQHSTAFQADSHSQAVASAALASLVPAWLAAGRGSEELWGSLIGALPGLPANRRLKLLEALRKALPEDAGLRVGLMLLMQRVVAATSPAPAAVAPATPTSPRSKTPGKKGKKPATAEPAEAAADVAAAAIGNESEWLPDLMAALCEQVAVPSRLHAFASVLSASLTDSTTGEAVSAHSPLPRLAVTFVTANLKAKSVLSAADAAASPAAAMDGSDPAAAASVPEACQNIMTQALMHLQQLNPATAAAATSSKSARKLQKAIRAAAMGVYDLLAALEAVQDCPSYLLALVQMSRHAAESVQRRALKLLANRLLKAQIDLADLDTATAALPAAEKQGKQRQLAQAGLAVCQELPRLLKSEAALTRQLALIAADAGIRQFGELLPSAVLSSLSIVVGAVGDAAAPVRVSALACIAAAVGAVGPKLVPLLPQTAATVLTAAEAACKDLEGFNHQNQQQQNSESAGSQQTAADSDEDEAEAAELSKGEAAALQLAGALAALEALVSGLHAFMSPYLKQVLQLLLHKQVLACSTAGGADAAARLRAMLPAKIPPRLLLDPLVSQWDYAVAASSGSGTAAQSAVAMLELVTVLCSSMEPAVAMKHHEQLLALLLRALDIRHRWLAAATGQQRAAGPTDGPDAAAAAAAVAGLGHADVYAIESAAVAALSALVIKLSESKFKPMFLRMVEWATAGSSSAAAAADDTAVNAVQAQGRAAAFFAAVCALGHRLRSIFAPYFRYFNILLMKQLAGGALLSSGRDKRPKKKHRKSSAAADADQPGSEELLLSGWLARLHAVRAVHILALVEPAAAAPAAVQEQQERFDRLLPLVVDALAEGPPAAVAAVLAVEGGDSALDLPGGPVAALGAAGKAAVEAGGAAVIAEQCDIVGTAAVGTMMQMAEAGGSDVMWKPLHHALLMATRGGGVRAKLLGIGGVSRLAEMLREEYLMLLPEALPFISELVEDGEVAVEGAAQGLVAQLEALSGERLEQYLKT